MILTVGQLREHITTALEDDALVRLLDAAEEAIDTTAGQPGEVTELVDGRYRSLLLAQSAGELVSVTEIDAAGTETLLVADTDYITRSPMVIEREVNARWGYRVRVVYHTADWATRIEVQVKLVELAINYTPGLQGDQIGPFGEQFAANSAYNYEIERQDILAPLRTSTGMVIV